jgi:aryl-phospho-beta-D-glucosidase BglC (GH1 family)
VNVSLSSLVPVAANSVLTFTPDVGNPVSITLTGNVLTELPIVPLPRITALGNQFIRSGVPFRLKGVNWYGAETSSYVPHGMWVKSYKAIIKDIADMGFNCIRLPFGTDGYSNPNLISPDQGAMGNSGSPNSYINPDLVGLTVYEVLDKIINACTRNGIYVLLDNHRNTLSGQDGTPIPTGGTVQHWHDVWSLMATRYANNTTVVGSDLFNEPYALLWADWKELAQNCGNYIHTIAPDWLIFVEGTSGTESGYPFWWGGNLEYVSTNPIVLAAPNKLVYSPHEYGQSVYLQSWLAYSGNTPANWPNNLNQLRTNHWAFIFEQNIAPVFVGEFGGFFGYDMDGNLTKPNGPEEIAWLNNLIAHMNGDFNNDGVSELIGANKGVSFAYWSLNHDSSDTGGLYTAQPNNAGWINWQTNKLALLSNLLSGAIVPKGWGNRVVYGYYPTWDNNDYTSATVQSGLTHTIMSFVQPDFTWSGSTTSWEGTGLDFGVSNTPAIIKSRLTTIQARGIKVFMSIGGSSYYNWSGLAAESGLTSGTPIKNALLAFYNYMGFDGIDIDYEINIDDGNRTTILAQYAKSIQALREVVDAATIPGKLCLTTVSVGADYTAYTVPAGSTLPQGNSWFGGNAGSERITFALSAIGAYSSKKIKDLVDMITIMSYDIGPEKYDPIVAYEDFRSICLPTTSVSIGIRISGSSAPLYKDYMVLSSDCVNSATIVDTDQYSRIVNQPNSVERVAKYLMANSGNANDGIMLWQARENASRQLSGKTTATADSTIAYINTL